MIASTAGIPRSRRSTMPAACFGEGSGEKPGWRADSVGESAATSSFAWMMSTGRKQPWRDIMRPAARDPVDCECAQAARSDAFGRRPKSGTPGEMPGGRLRPWCARRTRKVRLRSGRGTLCPRSQPRRSGFPSRCLGGWRHWRWCRRRDRDAPDAARPAKEAILHRPRDRARHARRLMRTRGARRLHEPTRRRAQTGQAAPRRRSAAAAEPMSG